MPVKQLVEDNVRSCVTVRIHSRSPCLEEFFSSTLRISEAGVDERLRGNLVGLRLHPLVEPSLVEDNSLNRGKRLSLDYKPVICQQKFQ
jgi:hypothetical protein